MEISNIEQFIHYHSRIKQRTKRLFQYIPHDKIEWTYREGKFTIGDLIRHLANIERDMYVETILHNESKYKGCGTQYAEGYENVVHYYESKYQESKAIFANLSQEDLNRKCKTPAGAEITVWKWLRAMIEHENHHRGQLYTYLGMIGIDTPPIFGLTSEAVIDLSN